MLAFVDLEERVPKDHPIRTIRAMADEALEHLSGEFDRMYSEVGRGGGATGTATESVVAQRAGPVRRSSAGCNTGPREPRIWEAPEISP